MYIILSTLQMLNEFCLITGVSLHEFQQKWWDFEELIFKYAALQDKQAVKKLRKDYGSSESERAGTISYIIFCSMIVISRHCFRSIYIICPSTPQRMPWPWEKTSLPYTIFEVYM